MTMTRSRTRSIQDFILDHVAVDSRRVARRVAQAYGISRQAANRHLDSMVEAGLLDQSGQTRAKEYHLRRVSALTRELRVTPVLNPDRVFEDHIAPILAGDRPAVRDLCRGAFGDLVRGAASRPGAAWVTVTFAATARHIDLGVADDGEAYFTSLAAQLRLASPREAAEEMARHARLRINEIPASRLILLARNFELFSIASSRVVLEFSAAQDLWVVRDGEVDAGTSISLRAPRHVSQSVTESLRELSPLNL